MTNQNFDLLYKTAHELIKSRYTPRKHVIAATVVGGSGKLYSAVNLDSHLRRAAVCAEGAAIAIAMSAGEEKITSLLALRYNPETDTSWVVSPCGVCRELILDYGEAATIYVPNENGEPKIETAAGLLPDRYAKNGKTA
jgi:cytidine deaminase